MAKLIYRFHEFPIIDLVAEDGEEVTPEQVTAWALFRLGNNVEVAGICIQNLVNEMP